MTTVKDVLDRKGSFVAYVNKSSTVLDATQEMNARRIGAVVVCDDSKVVGIFTERDILVRVVGGQLDPSTTLVGDVMTAPVACCVPDTTVEECRTVMTEKRIRHMPVVDENQLLGIVTSGDIMAQEKSRSQQTIKYLKEYIYGPYSHDPEED